MVLGVGARPTEEPERSAWGWEGGVKTEGRIQSEVSRGHWSFFCVVAVVELVELAADVFSQGLWRDGHGREL